MKSTLLASLLFLVLNLFSSMFCFCLHFNIFIIISQNMESLNKMLEWATTRRTLFSMDISSSELLTLTKETGGESALNLNAMSHNLLLLYRPRELLRFCPVFLQTVFFKHLRILSFVLQIAPPEHYKNTNLTIGIFTELFPVHFQTLFHTLIFFLDCFNNIFFDFFVCFSIV